MFRHFLSMFFFIIAFIFLIISFTFGWDVILQGYIRETFDDNITSVVETSFEKKKYDFITELMVGLGIRHEGKTQTLEIIGHVFQQIYAMNFGLTNNYQDIALNYTITFSDLVSFHVTDIFQNYPEPDRFEVLFGNSQGRMHYWRNNFGFTGLFEVNKHYIINLGYSNQFSKYFYTRSNQSYIVDYYRGIYSDERLKSSFANTALMQHELHWDSSNNTFVFYEYRWMNKKPGGISQVHRPGLGYRYNFTAQLYFECRLSPDIVVPYYDIRNFLNINNVTDYFDRKPYLIQLYSSATLVNDVDKKTNANLSFSYQTSVMDNVDDISQNWQLSGDVNRNIFPRLFLTSSIFYGQGVFINRNTTKRLFGFKISIEYEITEHVSAEISYNFTLNTTHLKGFLPFHGYIYNWQSGSYIKADSGYIRDRVSIGVRAEF